MSDKPIKRSTRSITKHVLENLLNSQDFDAFIEYNSDSLTDEDFIDTLNRFCEARNISKSDLVKLSGIDRTYAYQILRGDRKPTRDKVIQFAIGITSGLDDAQRLLRAAHHSALYPRIKRDAAIIFCLNQKLSIVESQQLLDKIGENLLD